MRRVNFCWVGICLACVVAPVGCATYRPQPLRPQAALEEDERVDVQALEREAAGLKHPRYANVRVSLSDGLAADEAVLVGLIRNPQLRAIRAARGVSAAEVAAARLLPNPEVTADVAFPVTEQSSNDATIGLGLAWRLSDLIVRPSRQREARAKQARTNLEIAWQEWRIEQAIKLHYVALAFLQKKRESLRGLVQAQTQRFRAAEKLVSLGETTTQTLLFAQADEADAQAALLMAERRMRAEARELKRLLGLPADFPLKLQNTDALFVATKAVPNAKALVRRALRQRLDLLAFEAAYRAEEERLRQAVLGQFPRLSLGPVFERNEDNVKFLGVGVAVEMPLFDRNQAAVARETATRKQLRLEYQARVHNLAATVYGGIEDLNESLRAVRLYTDATAPRLERATQLAAESEAAGVGTALDAISAKAARLKAAAAHWDTQLAAQLDRLAIETAAGGPLSGTSSSPTQRPMP